MIIQHCGVAVLCIVHNTVLNKSHFVTAVLCPPPLPPVNGRLVDEGPNYHVGSAVQFMCNERHQLVGESSVVCTETGVWSHPPPFCELIVIFLYPFFARRTHEIWTLLVLTKVQETQDLNPNKFW